MVRRSSLVLVVALVVSGCTSAAEKAKRRYEFLKEQRASIGEVCKAGKEWVRALSEDHDAENYSYANSVVDVDCLNGELNGAWRPYAAPREQIK